jgi:nicotinamide phosphoribosyltransferase
MSLNYTTTAQIGLPLNTPYVHPQHGVVFNNPIPTNSWNILTECDTYKLTHTYDGNNETLINTYAWIGARKGKSGPNFQVAVGQQHIAATIASYRVTKEQVDEIEEISNQHLGPNVFNRAPFDTIVSNGGYIPMRIWAVPEGTIIPRGVASIIVESTTVPEIVPFLEAHLQRIWYPTSVATRTTEYRMVVHKYLNKTTCPKVASACFPFRIHDFGVRSCATNEQSEIGGLAALEAGNYGTDNIPALCYAMKLMPDINPDTMKPKMPAFSVPAGEHNVAFSRGEDDEMIPLEIALDKYPTGFLSWPIDSFDSERFVDRLTMPGDLRNRLMTRDGKFVFRPDSSWKLGMPHAETVVELFKCITKNLSDLTPETGGIKVNSKGYFVLPDWLGVIYGDSVTVDDVTDIYNLMTNDTNKWSAENIVFGVGGNLLQNTVTRGWLDFAMKCSQQIYRSDITGEQIVRNVGKNTPGKVSPVGRLKVIERDGKFTMVAEDDGIESNIMKCYYEDGNLYNFESLQTIRDRVASYTKFTFE